VPGSAVDVRSVALNFRQLVLSFAAQLVVGGASLLFGDAVPVMILLATIATVTGLAFYAIKTAEGLGSPSALLWGVLLVPCVYLFTLLRLNSRASAVCRTNGIAVGLLGPRVD
jgi:hypothetical protein